MTTKKRPPPTTTTSMSSCDSSISQAELFFGYLRISSEAFSDFFSFVMTNGRVLIRRKADDDDDDDDDDDAKKSMALRPTD